MNTRLVIIGITIFVAIYLPIHYYYPFLGFGTTTEISVFCEEGFVQYGNKCVPDFKISKEISIDQENLKVEPAEFPHGIIKLDDVTLDV